MIIYFVAKAIMKTIAIILFVDTDNLITNIEFFFLP